MKEKKPIRVIASRADIIFKCPGAVHLIKKYKDENSPLYQVKSFVGSGEGKLVHDLLHLYGGTIGKNFFKDKGKQELIKLFDQAPPEIQRYKHPSIDFMDVLLGRLSLDKSCKLHRILPEFELNTFFENEKQKFFLHSRVDLAVITKNEKDKLYEIFLVDYKTTGKPVFAESSNQLLLGAYQIRDRFLKELEARGDKGEYTLDISGVIANLKSTEYLFDEYLYTEPELINNVPSKLLKIQKDKYVPGYHCVFCPASLGCPKAFPKENLRDSLRKMEGGR